MKVSDIVKAKLHLQEVLKLSDHNQAFNHYFETVNSCLLNIYFLRDRFEGEVQQRAQSWLSSVKSIENLLQQGIDECTQLIESHQTPLFTRSRETYAMMYANETDYVILNRSLGVDDRLYDSITTRLGSYSSWEYPALLIRPGYDSLIERLVASDPLYVMDQRQTLLLPAVEKFPLEYQRRIRRYLVEENAKVLEKIPNHQFNLIVAWNFFNYRPLELVCQYFEEVYQKLRPGGIFAFTFNDCDYASPTVLAELGQASYTPGHLILDCVKRLGFSILTQETNRENFHYIEVEKPGTLQSIRGGQCLAKIMPKY